MTVAQELALAAKLRERLTAEIESSANTLRTGLPFEKYQQACGMIVAWEQIRDVFLREAVEELQKG